jgi:hypothetical protein
VYNLYPSEVLLLRTCEEGFDERERERRRRERERERSLLTIRK